MGLTALNKNSIIQLVASFCEYQELCLKHSAV